MPLGLTSFEATFGLVIVFFVAFPLLAHGLIGFAVGQALGERAENREYFERGGAVGERERARKGA